MGTLYIVATPIGNLADISQRALEILRSVDLVAVEDTRVTHKLLAHYEISKPLITCHQHNITKSVEQLAGELKAGKNIALVTDAGTPGIADPGNHLIAQLIALLGEELKIIPLPGANAALALLSISGLPTDRFLFMGFPPHKKGRNKFFAEAAASNETVALYESPHRILKTLAALPADRPAVVGRELTKQFESVYRGTVGEILARYAKELPRGELVIVLAGLDY